MKTANAIFLTLAALATMWSCGKSGSPDSSVSPAGRGGSMARFAIVGNYLYTVDQSNLNIYDIANASTPVYMNSRNVGNDIETIFPTDSILYIGSMSGMYMYNLSNPAEPLYLSSYWHMTACDPVVIDDRYAYVTLSSESWCGNDLNELQIIDISDVSNPQEVTSYNMTNPKGLGVDDDLLFLCDNGLKVYDKSNVLNLQLKKHFSISAWDVIPVNGLLLVIGEMGFVQYSYQNDSLVLLSTIPVKKNT